MKKIIATISLFVIFSCNRTEKTYHGKIIRKMDPVQQDITSNRFTYYLTIEYTDGFIEERKTSKETYYYFEIGDSVQVTE